MVPRAFLLPISLGLASSARGAVHSLQSRAVQVAAICTPDFAWMDTQNQVSPCSVNANLNAVCNGGSWAIPALNSSFNYAVPGNPQGSNTGCSCSWAAYNTIAACAACQGFASGISGWDAYIQNCNGLTDSSNPFPSSLAPGLPQGFAVPFWATQNPTQWPNRRFDFPTAKSIQSQGHADVVLNPGSSQTKKKAPIGPIVGGVIGGIVIVVGAILVFLFIVRRKKNTQPSGPNVSTLGHLRSASDVSSKGFMTTTGYATLTSSTPMYTNAPSSPTVMTHAASSIRSMPFNSVIASSIPPTSSPPIPTSSPPPVPIAREDIIVPFTSRPSTPDRDRKHPNGPGAAFPIYDSPTAPPNQRPSIIQINGSVPNTPAQRGRINPPAYQESSPGATTPSSSSGNGQRRGPPHAKKGSADTHDSTSSGLPPVRYPGGHVPAAHPPSSMFATDLSRGDTITSTHTNATGYSRGEGPSVPAGHGRTVGGSRDEKRDPSAGPPPAGGSGGRDSTTINASDIA